MKSVRNLHPFVAHHIAVTPDESYVVIVAALARHHAHYWQTATKAHRRSQGKANEHARLIGRSMQKVEGKVSDLAPQYGK